MKTSNWIAGEWLQPNGGEVVVYNPSDLNEEVGVIYCSTEKDVRQAGEAAKNAATGWAKLTGPARGEYLYQIANRLEQQLEDVAMLASREMGKPITEMKLEVLRGVHLLRYYAGEGVRTTGNIIPSAQVDTLQYSKRVALGVVGLITPWNFPVAIPIWKLAPALICGNTVIWKPAENASLIATKLAQIFADAGLPAGVVNLVIGKGSVVGNVLVEKLEIDAISFTGSTAVGRQIAATCAKRNIKYQTEMGGKNAAIVCNDADLKETIPIILSGAFRSAGQKCTATSRVIVEKDILRSFLTAIRKGMSHVKVSNALDPAAYLGPVATENQYRTVRSFVNLARRDAEIIVEATMDQKERGYYIPPLVVSGVDANHSLVQEEIFGPVITILPAANLDDAIHLCNQSIYGLSASVFTQNLSNAFRFLEEAEAGMVRVNQETAGVEYQAPFGGMKLSSSHTREQGTAALDFYSQMKTCAIHYS
jgi:acyl-CoA reductase-like NAD-dependent aldehyde dehydrogenase